MYKTLSGFTFFSIC